MYGLLVTCDDFDVLPESLTHALSFCDKVIAMDNMSTDGTWEYLEAQAAALDGRVIAHRQFSERFYDGIRGELYNELHGELGEGWWMLFAADEFMVEDPRPLLREAEEAGCDAVFAWMAQFQFTTKDLAAYEAGLEDPSVSVRERRTYYRTDWREFRFVQNDPERPWEDDDCYLPRPIDEWRVHKRMAVLEHYQWRSPEQMQRRVDSRLGLFAHVNDSDWRQYVKPAWRYNRQRPGQPVKVVPAWQKLNRLRQEIQRLRSGTTGGFAVSKSD